VVCVYFICFNKTDAAITAPPIARPSDIPAPTPIKGNWNDLLLGSHDD